MERDLILTPLAVDALPEIDRALEPRRNGECVVRRLRDRRARRRHERDEEGPRQTDGR